MAWQPAAIDWRLALLRLDIAERRAKTQQVLEDEGLAVFAELDVVRDVAGGIVSVAQANGMAGMATCNKNDIDLKLAWPSGEWGSLPVEGGVAAAYRREIEASDNPKRREQELEAELRAYSSPFRTAEALAVEEIIDPRETRAVLCEYIALAQDRLRIGLGPRAKSGVAP